MEKKQKTDRMQLISLRIETQALERLRWLSLGLDESVSWLIRFAVDRVHMQGIKQATKANEVKPKQGGK